MESLGDILRRVTQRPTFEGGGSPPANEVREGEPACPICGGVGWITLNVGLDDPRFGQAQPCSCLSHDFEEERRERFVRLSNLGALKRFTFDSLKAQDGTPDAQRRFEEVVAAARVYSEVPNGWFVIAGAGGSGKTPIVAAVANEAIAKGTRASFMTVPDLLDHLRGAYGPHSEVAYDDLFEELKNVPMLVLDDLGTHSATPWAQEKLYQLFNHRYQNELPTVIALACEVQDLDEHLQIRLADRRVSQVHRLAYGDSGPAFQQLGSIPQKMLGGMAFERFDLRGGPDTDATGRGTLEAAFRFAQNFAENPEGWVVFTGVPGCGKTHLAAAIAGEQVKRGHPVFFVMVPDLLDHLRHTFSPDSKVSYDRMFEQVKNAPLLILDDLGMEQGTPWAQEKLYQIFAHRYNLRLPMIITTSNEKLDDLPPSIASRLRDGSLVAIQPIAAADYRPKGTGRYRSRGNAPEGRRSRPPS
jgi:DNA replication protein DnaC